MLFVDTFVLWIPFVYFQRLPFTVFKTVKLAFLVIFIYFHLFLSFLKYGGEELWESLSEFSLFCASRLALSLNSVLVGKKPKAETMLTMTSNL